MRRKLAFALLGVILVSILFIAGIFFLKPEVFRKSSDKENQTISQVGPIEYNKPVEYFWGEERMGWISGKSDDPNAEAVADVISIEFTKEICGRKVNPACGFKEFGGTFQEVVDTVSYATSLLDGVVGVNMELKDDGSYIPLSPLEKKKLEFDIGLPVRFIYEDGDRNSFPLVSSGFSRGWGVDPETKGLIVFIGMTSSADNRVYDSHIFGNLREITGIFSGNTIISQDNYNKMFNLWYGDDKNRPLELIVPN